MCQPVVPVDRTTAINLPRNKLSEAEHQEVLDVCASEERASLLPSQIAPYLRIKAFRLNSYARTANGCGTKR